MVPFLCNFLKEILTSLLQMFILNNTIKKANTTLTDIDTNDVNLQKPYGLIQIGTAAWLHVANYKKSTDLKESTLQRFYKKVHVACFFSKPFHGKISIKASQRNSLVKLWKNWLPLAFLNQRRQAKLRTSMKKSGRTSPKIQRRVC